MRAPGRRVDEVGATEEFRDLRPPQRIARQQQLHWTGSEITAHPMFDYRKVPTSKLKQRLDVMMFADEAPMTEMAFTPKSVRIPLAQHQGAPAQPVVKEGQRVKRYEMIGKSGGKISTAVHASIDGVVSSVSSEEIQLARA